MKKGIMWEPPAWKTRGQDPCKGIGAELRRLRAPLPEKTENDLLAALFGTRGERDTRGAWR